MNPSYFRVSSGKVQKGVVSCLSCNKSHRVYVKIDLESINYNGFTDSTLLERYTAVGKVMLKLSTKVKVLFWLATKYCACRS